MFINKYFHLWPYCEFFQISLIEQLHFLIILKLNMALNGTITICTYLYIFFTLGISLGRLGITEVK